MPIKETLETMEKLRQDKKIRHIGLSNVTINHIKRALETGVLITWVQVEMNPIFFDPELVAFCQEKGIGVQAWAPLGRGRISKDSTLIEIGKKYRKSPSQVAIKWIIQHGCVPLPGSGSSIHIKENFSVNDFMLTSEEMKQIDDRAKRGQRQRLRKDWIGFF